MKAYLTVEEVRNEFIEKYKNGDFVVAKDGTKMLEIPGIVFDATNVETIFKKFNKEYADAEIKWYESQSLNVYDIRGYKIPEIWKNVADKDGFINSNYGWCIYSKENYDQYRNCLKKLIEDNTSRQAMMIYTRPSIQYEWNKNGMHDFICTNNVQVMLRKSKGLENNEWNMIYIVNQRSVDAIFGFRNDAAWHRYVIENLKSDLKYNKINVKNVQMIYQCGSIHIYQRHFDEITKEIFGE